MKQELDDKQLLAQMQNGDRKAMEAFFRRYSPYLFAVCLRYVPDREAARDLLHDTFIKIFASISTFKLDERSDETSLRRSLKSWCARIAANHALNYLRDNAHLRFVSIYENPQDEIPDDEIDADDLSIETINLLIEKLPPNYRAVFCLFAIEGFTHREVAGMLGISEGASATIYHRAKAALKQLIRQHIANAEGVTSLLGREQSVNNK